MIDWYGGEAPVRPAPLITCDFITAVLVIAVSPPPTALSGKHAIAWAAALVPISGSLAETDGRTDVTTAVGSMRRATRQIGC